MREKKKKKAFCVCKSRWLDSLNYPQNEAANCSLESFLFLENLRCFRSFGRQFWQTFERQ